MKGIACYSYLDLTRNSLYNLFLDNRQTEGHQSIIIGLRELQYEEMIDHCSNQSSNTSLPMTDTSFHFTSNYELRLFRAGCYYLDSNQQWQSDGLLVISPFLSPPLGRGRSFCL